MAKSKKTFDGFAEYLGEYLLTPVIWAGEAEGERVEFHATQTSYAGLWIIWAIVPDGGWLVLADATTEEVMRWSSAPTSIPQARIKRASKKRPFNQDREWYNTDNDWEEIPPIKNVDTTTRPIIEVCRLNPRQPRKLGRRQIAFQ